MPERRTVTIDDLLERQREFYAARPLMDEQNRHIGNLVQFLLEEVRELNGHTSDGMTLEKYREQETADLGWFGFALMRRLQLTPSKERIAMESQRLVAEATQKTNEQPGKSYEHAYEAIKGELQQSIESLAWIIPLAELPADTSAEKRAEVQETLENIFSHIWALFRLYGVNPEEALLEKHARNIVKHTAKHYTESPDFPTAVQRANTEWKEIRGNLQFYETEKYAPPTEPLLTDEERAYTRDPKNDVRNTPSYAEAVMLQVLTGQELIRYGFDQSTLR